MGNASVIKVAFRVDFKLETDDGSLFGSTAEALKPSHSSSCITSAVEVAKRW